MLARFLVASAVLVFADPVQAGTIDCGKPISRVEMAICIYPELLARERTIELKRSEAAADDNVQLPRLRFGFAYTYAMRVRAACDIDPACIAHYQEFAVLRLAGSDKPEWELPAFSDKRDPFLLYFDKYAKMRITIFRRVGIDTENAVITAKHTNREVCEDTIVTVSSRCIEEEHLRPLMRLTANCPAATFTTLYGDDRKFIRGAAEDRAGYSIIDVGTGEDIETKDPDAYARDLAQFRALCPSRF